MMTLFASSKGRFNTMTDVKFADFARLLARQGFERLRVEGSHYLFTHPQTSTTVMLPLLKSKQRVEPLLVASARHRLDARGILSEQDFDDQLSQGNGRRQRAVRSGRRHTSRR
jgi:predicted RNA binding protein YcfA (HicA-like mRNA interferase family)